MKAEDKKEILAGAVGYFRTVRNLHRRKGDEGKARAAQEEIDRLQFELGQIKKQEASDEAA